VFNNEEQTFLVNKLNKITRAIEKIQNRFKLQDYYKYTNKDVAIVQKALQELDNLSSYYLTESLKIFEPIINSILNKINFNVKFKINDKNKFDIALDKDGTEYSYDDLSEGQKLLVQIAFKLALLLERGEEGIVIADEGLSSLDFDNLDHVLTIFKNLPYQLFIVLHNLETVPVDVQIIDLKKEE
jgi:DNA repair exonuclease SbcCD ATPase subunit